jgi:mevalonate kinase
MEKAFYSHGKLLLTSEYLVLDGAQALAVPTKLGQSLTIENSQQANIHWQSMDCEGNNWFETQIDFKEIKTNHTQTTDVVTKTLINILHHACLMNSDFLNSEAGLNVLTKLEFPRAWGLGSSSTLINNIASWAGVDAFELLERSFGGSGYDIACAQNDQPIIYQRTKLKPQISKVDFTPSFSEHIYFVYLNQKQSSKDAIANYKTNYKTKDKTNLAEAIQQANQYTQQLLQADNLTTFCEIIDQHEQLLSEILKTKTVKETLFPNFKGSIKSLGAWGGDFVMAISDKNPTEYFESKGYHVVKNYTDMVL